MQDIKLKFKKEAGELKKEFVQKTAGLIIAGFGLIAALAWNEAIKSLFDVLFGPTKASLFAKFLYAAIITLIVVIVSKRISFVAENSKGKSFNIYT